MDYLLELVDITKRFGDFTANSKVALRVREGTVHSIVGENGAGKTTLMNILYGLLRPDAGRILLREKEVFFASPLDSIKAGLGMIHQHFMLIPVMTVLDNIILGYETGGIRLDRRQSRRDLAGLLENFGLPEKVLNTRLGELPVGIQQKIEIIKALYRKADIIVLDEPTAVLTPLELDEFFAFVKRLKEEKKTILFISHKLSEILAISDDITVMRAGSVVNTVERKDVDQKTLARMMIGRDLSEQKIRYRKNNNRPVIEVEDLVTQERPGGMALKSVGFCLQEGEILGIAGVAGNGQRELVEALVGTSPPRSGSVRIKGRNLAQTPVYRRPLKMAYIPEDRQAEGLVSLLPVSKNLILGKTELKRFISRGIFINNRAVEENARSCIERYSIKIAGGPEDPVNTLSGGNQQKLIVARELNDDPSIILAVNPTRGIDISSIEYIHSCLIREREKGKSVLLISNELSEIMALSDRIAIMHSGRIIRVFDNNGVTKEEIGYYMLSGGEKEEAKP
jgi:simple sugar transport system ATP-binding protein